jgi:elongation factor G
LHLEIIVDRLKREFNVAANVGEPRVAFRETITVVSEAVGRVDKQMGAKSLKAEVVIRVEPGTRGAGVIFRSEVNPQDVPLACISAVEESVRGSIDAGVLAGYPMVDLEIIFSSVMHNEVDNSELAYKIAASIGLRDALRNARPALLEPIMAVQIVVPEDFMGEVVGDINRRQGRITGMAPRGVVQVIDANVPLRQMFGYTTDLRTATQGRANYTMQFAHFDFVPDQIAKSILG